MNAIHQQNVAWDRHGKLQIQGLERDHELGNTQHGSSNHGLPSMGIGTGDRQGRQHNHVRQSWKDRNAADCTGK